MHLFPRDSPTGPKAGSVAPCAPPPTPSHPPSHSHSHTRFGSKPKRVPKRGNSLNRRRTHVTELRSRVNGKYRRHFRGQWQLEASAATKLREFFRRTYRLGEHRDGHKEHEAQLQHGGPLRGLHGFTARQIKLSSALRTPVAREVRLFAPATVQRSELVGAALDDLLSQ